MSVVHKTYCYRIYPTQEQIQLIEKTFGCVRFVYNKLLEKAKEEYSSNGRSKIFTPAFLKKEYPWLKDVDSLALCNAQQNLRADYHNFFSKKTHFPKFKTKKGHYQSYKTNFVYDNIKILKNKIQLPKIGLVKTVISRFCYGKIKNVIVCRTPSNKYFVKILVEQEKRTKTVINKKENVLGVDMSIKELAVYSDGTKAKYPQYYRKSLKKLAKTQRKFSKTIKDSKRHEKQRIKLARIHERVKNQRRDFLNNETTRIANLYNVVVIESLHMKDIAKLSFRNGKSVYDVGFGLYRKMLEYKLNERQGKLIKADRFYPSSQLCSNCNFKNKAVKNISIRTWICPKCGKQHDRDINAAINLVHYYTVTTTEINARGEELSPHADMQNGIFKESRKVVG